MTLVESSHLGIFPPKKKIESADGWWVVSLGSVAVINQSYQNSFATLKMSIATYPPLPASPIKSGVVKPVITPNQTIAELIETQLKKNRIHNLSFSLVGENLEHKYYGRERITVEMLHQLFRPFWNTTRQLYENSNNILKYLSWTIAGYEITAEFSETLYLDTKVSEPYCEVHFKRIISK